MTMFLDILRRYESAELGQGRAAELLGVTERTFRRWTQATRRKARPASWTAGSARCRASGSRANGRKKWSGFTRALPGFTVKHFHEHLVRTIGSAGATPGRSYLQSGGVLQKAPRKGAHRRKRPRRPLPGMMLHQDGSRHAWLEGEPALDLIVTLDDATGAIYSAFLVEEEGTDSTFRALREVFPCMACR